ncbi:MAG: DNA repair protein RecN [Steroidobacteraceae bacterium]|jgi:DNA repair protein RecN (Recombination protein N)
MLRYLQIRDFAIIDQVELEFSGGLTVLTGETGAGKSILVDALELLAGGRAGADVVRAGAERADITATIDISAAARELRDLLEEQSIAVESELQLRRVIGNDGRSRAWLGGQAVALQVLSRAAELLFDIHGQHEFQSLVRPVTQRTLVDGYGRLEALVGQVRSAHSVWLALLNRSLEVESAANERGSRLETLRYQVQEIDALGLRAGEIEELQAERARLANRGRLLEAVGGALQCLYEADAPTAHTLLAKAITALRAAEGMDEQIALLTPLLEEAALRVKDASHSLLQYLDGLEVDPQRADAIERRLAAIEELARKHRVAGAALTQRREALELELAVLESAIADRGALRAQLDAALASYQESARQLSARRATAARALAKDISARMQELGMGGGRFLIEISPLETAEPAAHGIDRVEFRVSTNVGQAPRAVAKIASGGELARLSLAVQVACAAEVARCMVFDEVDAGIGGAVAEIVGRELRVLGASGQVLCVTHLPQVAAQGLQHLRVAKLNDGTRTRISVSELNDEERVEELARMLGGVEITARARAHALEMLASVAQADLAHLSADSPDEPVRNEASGVQRVINPGRGRSRSQGSAKRS